MKARLKIIWMTLLTVGMSITGSTVDVDIYQYMAGGNPGDVLTSAIMEVSSIDDGVGVDVDWIPEAGTMWVSNLYARSLPGVVTVNGQEYSGGLGSFTWRVEDRWARNYILVKFGTGSLQAPLVDKITIACYYTPGDLTNASNAYYLDTLVVGNPGQTWSVLGKYAFWGGVGLNIRAHGTGTVEDPRQSSDPVLIEADKTYWVNLHHDGINGVSKVAIFDPDNNWELVGMEEGPTNVGPVGRFLKFGRKDSHADYTTDDVSSYFSHLMIDYSEAKFPLLPDGVGPIFADDFESGDTSAWQNVE